MPLTDDQRAMLQLLLQRRQSYGDIAALLGLEVEQVRARARAALTEIGGEDPDREVSLTDYLLGQADPIGRADAARHLQSDATARDLAERLTTQLRVLAPGAELPDLTGSGGEAVKPRDPAAPASESAGAVGPGRRRPLGGWASTLSRRQRQAMAGLVVGGLLTAALVLAVTGVFSGSSEKHESRASSTASNSCLKQRHAHPPPGLTRAVLEPSGGSDACGVAVFAKVRDFPVLDVNVVGLKPSGAGTGYIVWLRGPNAVFPLTPAKVGRNGSLQGRIQISARVLKVLQAGVFDSVDVSRTKIARLRAALKTTRRSGQSIPYVGRSVARGTFTGPGFTSTSRQ
jgi:hypothetical protein